MTRQFHFRVCMYPKELRTETKQTLVVSVLAALFTIANRWKQTKCPSTYEGINKMLYIPITGYFSALKSTKILKHVPTWKNLKNIILNKLDTKGQTLRDSKSNQIHRDRKENKSYHRPRGGRNSKLLFSGYRFSVWNNEKVLEMISGDGSQYCRNCNYT